MTDRELLGWAAKAVGYWVVEPLRYGEFRVCLPEQHHLSFGWNPLTDDGDALRLAVDLRLQISHFDRWADNAAVVQAADLDAAVCEEEVFNDPYAATRRAIVKAAAESGRSMT